MTQPAGERSAVVTGASSGIGQAIAIALARSGVTRLLIHYQSNQEGAERTAATCKQFGSDASICAADLSEPGDCNHLVETAFSRFGSIQSWVNNAGADVLTGDAAKLDFDAKLRRLMDVDLIGTIRLSRLVADRMILQATSNDPADSNPAAVVFIGWDQAPHGMEGDAGQMFAPVKAGVMAFAASLAQHVAPHVRVNTIAPGWIQTAWGASTNGYWQDRAKQQSLMHRWGTPEDVARAVVYVTDPNNSFLNGQTINVNGGWNRKHSE